MDSYRQDAGNNYWSQWPAISWEPARFNTSNIRVDVFYSMAMECDYPYKELLDEIVNDIRFGATIGVPQEFSNKTNAPSALEYGDRVPDSLCKMMHDGYLMGPFSDNELPFKENRFSGLMVKLKPEGLARIILNLSKGDQVSVNEGIN